MALWMVRAGKHGEHENRFLFHGEINLTWEGMEEVDLSNLNREQIRESLHKHYPDAGDGTINNWTAQFCAFKEIKPKDWVALPRKTTPAIAFGEVTSEYRYDTKAEPIYRHKHGIDWKNVSVPRIALEKDIRLSLQAVQSICKISRNDAEKRIRQFALNGWRWKPVPSTAAPLRADLNAEATQPTEQPVLDLEELALDNIAKLIEARFKGHGLARLVAAILKAQGYTTHVSPEGPDKGIDILAGAGPLGFGPPKICVQVKSGSDATDMATVNQLIGAMQNVHADQGLFVAWSGYKISVDRERATQFFRVRLWDQADVIEQLFQNYDRLDEDIRAELPLKRIWTIATESEE